MKAINIISIEHSSLAAVINAMLFLGREIRDRGTQPDFPLFGAMLSYIDCFSFLAVAIAAMVPIVFLMKKSKPGGAIAVH